VSELIFDVGFHRGEDTRHYLETGYRVVAIDADPRNIEWARREFAAQLQSGQLLIEHASMSHAEATIDFHLSKSTVWSSIKSGIAGRQGRADRKITVPTRRLDRLFEKYGTLLYCKVDFEGYDAICVGTLSECPHRPLYISVDSERLVEGEKTGPEVCLETLHVLPNLGYDRFKLVDQSSLQVLSREIIHDDRPLGWYATIRKLLGRGYDSLWSIQTLFAAASERTIGLRIPTRGNRPLWQIAGWRMEYGRRGSPTDGVPSRSLFPHVDCQGFWFLA
jgi:FkbM family methyltransferase